MTILRQKGNNFCIKEKSCNVGPERALGNYPYLQSAKHTKNSKQVIMTHTQITCPKCGNDIDVNDILTAQLDEQYQQKYNQELAKEKKKIQEQQDAFEKQKSELEEKQRQQEQLVADAVSTKLKQEKAELEKQIKTRLTDENSERLAALEKELNEKSEQVKELNKAKAEIQRINREKNELKESIEAEAEQRLNQQITEEKEKIRKQEQEKNDMKIRELQKQLEDQKKLTDEMSRKQEQGSMQLQGEVQELGIEEWLSSQFPLDTIDEIKKGERGADCIQTVHTRQRQNCATIIEQIFDVILVAFDADELSTIQHKLR